MTKNIHKKMLESNQTLARTSHRDNALDKLVSVHLAEYDAMRSELLQVQGAQGQLVLYSLVTMAAAIPVLASLLENSLWQSLLIVPIIFSSMGWVYAGYIGMSYRISIYVKNFLRPSITELLQKELPDTEIDVLAWEHFARTKGLNILAVPKGFEMFFFALPSIGSILLFFVIKNTSHLPLISLDWALLIIDGIFLIGSLVMASIVGAIGYRSLANED